ncbi:MAG: sensor histidine kinase [Parvibaculaceae bacterium]
MLSKLWPERHEAKFFASLLALGMGGLLVLLASWFAAHSFASRMADLEAERRATKWSERALTSLQSGKPTFDQAELTPADKARLYDLLLASDIYRYVLYRADGEVFWSSKLSKVGSRVEGGTFAPGIAEGQVHIKPEIKKADEIDGLLWRKGSLGLNPNSSRNVISVYVPVMLSDRFVGVIETYVDATDIIAFYARQAQIAAVALGGAFSFIFLAVAAMMVFYARERRSNIRALTKARDDAVLAERSSRELAGELQLVNDDIVTLNQELATNMRKLSEAQDEIVRKGKLAQLGQLTATVAHEIRNPLGTVRTAAFLIERKIRGRETGLETSLQRINNGVLRCDGIITELLDFARSKALQLSSCTFDEWAGEIVREEQQKLPSEIAIECRLGLGPQQVAFDPDRMQRVLINLLSNASEALLGRKEGPRRLSTSDPRIVVSTSMGPRGVEISVSDNGPGIAPDDMERILEPLFTTKNFGVGLGLPAVLKIIEQHQGGLDVHSRPGEGATFTAWFPAEGLKEEAA